MAVDDTRVRQLNDRPVNAAGDYVLYWMQASQRVASNDALVFAIEQANALRRPLVVFFGLVPAYLGARARHYRFMLEGLCSVGEELRQRNIGFVLQRGSPERAVLGPAAHACCCVLDRGYLRHQRRWYRHVMQELDCRAYQVEANVVVPVEVASDRAEYAARTFRPRVNSHLERYLQPVDAPDVENSATEIGLDSLASDDLNGLLSALGFDPEDDPLARDLPGGTQAARELLSTFVKDKLASYDQRNDPTGDVSSGMSPYLHFGQISPVEIALRVRETGLPTVDDYLEQLIVRRELAINMVHRNPAYDRLDVLPDWARTTLQEHADDPREWDYTLTELEDARTHDDYWNAAQREMVLTGTMHGYMRMYWGKKILEWSPDPGTALARMVYLNDTYELDGRDPNGYAGTAWCLGKHDQAWKERPIYGKVRYMNARGLERKFDIEDYVRRVGSLEENASPR